jgi:hypothetical protein
MSWTGGYTIASARDVAKFYWDLLGPDRYILSEESYKKALQFELIPDMKLVYGAGLMIETANLSDYTATPNLTMNDTCAFVGHAGETYGFSSV